MKLVYNGFDFRKEKAGFKDNSTRQGCFGRYLPFCSFKLEFCEFQQLKQQRDKLKQYQKRIELTLTRDRDLAKKLLNKGQKE